MSMLLIEPTFVSCIVNGETICVMVTVQIMLLYTYSISSSTLSWNFSGMAINMRQTHISIFKCKIDRHHYSILYS